MLVAERWEGTRKGMPKTEKECLKGQESIIKAVEGGTKMMGKGEVKRTMEPGK